MNGTTHAGEPPYTTSDDSGNTQGGAVYDVGFACIVLLFIIILCYTSYKCKRSRETRSSLTPTVVSIRTIAGSDSDSDDDHCMRLSGGLDDDILSTFPTFIYSEAVKKIRDGAVNEGSGCSICLADYRPADVVRLLPECGHLFHVNCIDTWLMVHSTCPICRKSLPATLTELTN